MVIVSIIYIILALYYLVFGIYKRCKMYGKLSTFRCEENVFDTRKLNMKRFSHGVDETEINSLWIPRDDFKSKYADFIFV